MSDDCPRCHGTGIWPLPRLGNFYAYVVACDCSAGEHPPYSYLGSGFIHEPAIARHGNRVAWVDKGIKDDIELLWAHGIETVFSCEGGAVHTTRRYVVIDHDDPERIELACSLLPWVSGTSTGGIAGRTCLDGEWSEAPDPETRMSVDRDGSLCVSRDGYAFVGPAAFVYDAIEHYGNTLKEHRKSDNTDG